ncbi:hypothetical protein SOJ29_05250, partial [Treponema pallidum]
RHIGVLHEQNPLYA